MEVEVIRVKYFNESREFHVPAGGIPLEAGDVVIVETEDGLDCCEVTAPARECPRRTLESPSATVLRKATPNDLEWLATKEETEETAAEMCRELAAKLELEMKLSSVKMTFDGAKVIFFFSADKRVDFRTLVRELAKTFRTRIEMRQIGVRDKAKQMGGLAVCGRPLCCTIFLETFDPVTMKMAKVQNLTLSPSKISGYCGRLMCCLAYENEFYRSVKEAFPGGVGKRVSTPQGEGEVKAVLALTGAVVVMLDSGAAVKVKLAEVEPVAEAATRTDAPPETEDT
ncbi:MAG TPA: regulatory iron-sulfur-containing complex subunit RicT [bacterium]|nr:regulatory iron-sulfur-containing complex subunit RicT [bacterium]